MSAALMSGCGDSTLAPKPPPVATGVPVATVAVGGGRNAGILAAEILSTSDAELQSKIVDYKNSLRARNWGRWDWSRLV